jgi:hypothetical protein
MIRRIVVNVALLLAGCVCYVHFAQAQSSSKARIEAFAKLPDWSGLWEFDIWTDELDGQQMGPEGMRKAKYYAAAMQATFTPAWQSKLNELRKTADAARTADAANPPAFEEFGRFGGCGWTPGFPATMLPGTYEWRVTPEETTLISLLGSVRHIYTDGRPHPSKDELWPMSQGDSIGHWEGDTLVVDTVSIRSPVYLPGLARGAGVPFVPMSNELHTVERIRMVKQDQMQIQFMLEDPIALAKPVNVTITWNRVKDINRMEQNADDCDDPSTDRNPIVNGRYMTVVKPTPATPAPAPTTPSEPTGR